ncbi:MAG: tyrosine-type recombinase/integrase [Halobacteriota archaeon]|nr:tyrosine-type recombinase/integrase [Halobacteriota archaeon]
MNNIKHKAILILIYSAGLRVNEVVKLRPEDVDTQRKLIHIRSAKG